MAQKLTPLLDNWKNAEDLLNQDAKELGEVLLDHLLDFDESQRIIPDQLISYRLFSVG